MPGGDGTGPLGMGPMTGRGAGPCAGTDIPGSSNMPPGRGRGMGFGRTRWAVPYYGNAPYLPVDAGPYGAAPTREQELEMLKSQAEGFQGALQDVQQRISELETEAKK